MKHRLTTWAACLALSTMTLACGGEDAETPAENTTENTTDGGNNASDAGGVDGASEDSKVSPPSTKLGPHNIGFRTIEHTYTASHGDIPERKLTINIWYPTDDKKGEEPTYFGTWPVSIFKAFEGETVIKDANLAAPDGTTYPLLVTSHGANGFGASTATIHHFFASYGWVVAAPDHVTDTLSDVGQGSPAWLRLARPLDISASIDALEKLPATDPLAGKVDTKKVAMTGHSRGGVTTWAASGAKFDRSRIDAKCKSGGLKKCTKAMLDGYEKGAHDKRIVCGIPMAGAGGFDPWFGDTGHAQAKVPQLQMSGSIDKDDPQQVFDKAGKVPLTWIDIKGGCHQAFAMGKCDKLPDKVGFPIIDTYALAFARHHVLDDSSASVMGLLDGSLSISKLVTLKRKNVPK